MPEDDEVFSPTYRLFLTLVIVSGLLLLWQWLKQTFSL
mgnify:CR=1 FL=1